MASKFRLYWRSLVPASAALGSNTQRPQHMKALHHSQVAAAVRTVEATDAHWATVAAFKFLTLTATRSGEVTNATWDEIDLATATWIIPPPRAHENRTRAPGALQHRCSNGSLHCTPEDRRQWSGLPITNRTVDQ